jgi:hypothetical protein
VAANAQSLNTMSPLVAAMSTAAALRCPSNAIESFTNATIVYPAEYLVGSVAWLSCPLGWDLAGPAVVACLSTGQWDTNSLSNAPSMCVARQCQGPYGNDLLRRSSADGATNVRAACPSFTLALLHLRTKLLFSAASLLSTSCSVRLSAL